MPLRASNIPYGDLRHIIILGNMEFIKRYRLGRKPCISLYIVSREWKLLANMPKISVMDGSPSNRADLRAVKVNLCRTCVILSAKVMQVVVAHVGKTKTVSGP
jgi:potassium large conductance calcium-activated channel subfamily M alpha protein 1